MSENNDNKPKGNERNMTNKERHFVQVYSETGSATDAAEAAYNTKDRRAAGKMGSKVLSRPRVQLAIATRFEEEWPDADRDIVLKLREIVTNVETSNRDAIAAIRELARLKDLYPAQKSLSIKANIKDRFKLPGEE